MSRLSLRIVGSHALASIGMSLPWPLLLWLVWEQTHDEWLLGLAGAARMLPYVLFSWAAGRVADRVRRDLVVRVSLFLRIGLLVAMAVALALGWTAAAVVCAAAAVAVSTPAYPALAAAMPAAAGLRHRRATDLLVTVEVASYVVGPALGGLLLVPATRDLVPAASVALVGLGAVLFAGIRLPRPVSTGAGHGSAAMLPVLRSSAPVRRALWSVSAVNAAEAVLGMALLPLAELAWHRGGTAYGLATSVLGLGALLGPVLGGLGRTDGARVRIGFAIMAGGVLAVAPSTGPVMAVVPLMLASAASVQVESAATGLLQEHVPDSVRAGILGVADAVMVGAAMLASLVAPVLASWLGPGVLIALVAVACAAATRLGRPAPLAVPTPAPAPADSLAA